MALIIGLTMALTGCSSSSDNKVVLNENQIGWYVELPSEGEYANYELVTPRGKELVAGTTNLNKSINEYIKQDVFGKEVELLTESQKKRFRVTI